MVDEAKAAWPNETGGVLLGYWVNRTDELVITHVVGPGPNARHGSRSFVPDGAYHEAEIARQYERSDRVIVYLGDWHSHPGSGPQLSRRDRHTLRVIARFEAARLAKPVMVVVGNRRGWTLAAWRYSSSRHRLLPRRAVPLVIRFFESEDALQGSRERC